jgi:superfamily II DNA/RNA helicase
MRGVTKVLIATDSYARGIDVPDLKMMVNFELPVVFDPATKRYNPDRPDYATFQHRCGRVGRFEAVGVCVHLVASEQEARQLRGFLDHFHLAAHELPESALESTPTIESALKAPLPPPVGATSEAGAGAGAGSAAPASGGAGLPTAVAGNRLASAAFAAALPLDPGAKWGDAAVGK